MLFEWEISFSSCCSLYPFTFQFFTYFCVIYLNYWSCLRSGANPRTPLTLSGSHLLPPDRYAQYLGICVELPLTVTSSLNQASKGTTCYVTVKQPFWLRRFKLPFQVSLSIYFIIYSLTACMYVYINLFRIYLM